MRIVQGVATASVPRTDEMGYGCGYELVFVPAGLGQFLVQLRPR